MIGGRGNCGGALVSLAGFTVSLFVLALPGNRGCVAVVQIVTGFFEVVMNVVGAPPKTRVGLSVMNGLPVF